ncbi:DUF2149 domain-containing protein [Pseudomonas zhanjiangensis]|uniref:DUF2149 domain-containing protein n=1 Tax=Pseudomonas zhanjiangensis TaxID=3239015 RepID=A0ABV3YXB4_9PSED
MSRWRSSRFDEVDTDPLSSVANLVDLMLVFACGLLVALAAKTDVLAQLQASRQEQSVERGRELPRLPDSLQGQGGRGLQSVGQVYRDPESGKLILIGD